MATRMDQDEMGDSPRQQFGSIQVLRKHGVGYQPGRPLLPERTIFWDS
jgi:hypothetical protein